MNFLHEMYANSQESKYYIQMISIYIGTAEQ